MEKPLDLADEKLRTLFEIMDDLKIIETDWSAAKELLRSAHKLLFEDKESTKTLLEGAKTNVLKAHVDGALKKRVAKEILEIERILRRA